MYVSTSGVDWSSRWSTRGSVKNTSTEANLGLFITCRCGWQPQGRLRYALGRHRTVVESFRSIRACRPKGMPQHSTSLASARKDINWLGWMGKRWSASPKYSNFLKLYWSHGYFVTKTYAMSSGSESLCNDKANNKRMIRIIRRASRAIYLVFQGDSLVCLL